MGKILSAIKRFLRLDKGIPGCDMSYWQRGIDIAKVKEQYNFAILRCGLAAVDTRTRSKDTEFENFYEKSRELELPVGAFYYSCSNTYEEGVDDAIFVLKILDGRKLEYPVYIDIENDAWQGNRKEGVTDAIRGFCETMLAGGYFAGVYSSTWWFDNYIDTAKLDIWSKWVACWRNTKPSFKYSHFDIWQNSESGYVGKYKIDTDFCYTDLPQTIREMGLNGYGVWGDVNGNGKLDTQDYAMVKRYVLGTYELTKDQKERADVSGDGKVTAKDYAMIKRMYLGTYGGKK